MTAPAASVVNAHAFVQRLIDLGLQHAVLSPGSRNAPIAITLARAAERGLITLHVRIDEREAAFLALGLGKRSDIPALLCCTSGTAAVNFAPAVVEAFYSQVPMLVLTADRPTGAAARGASQTIEQDSLYSPHTVANLKVSETADSQAAADRARIAWNATRGPVRGPAHVNMHLVEPLVSPIAQWPSEPPANPVPATEPAFVPPLVPHIPDLGDKPAMVIGEVPHHQRHHIATALNLARTAQMPVIMEPTAGSRPAEVAIRHHSVIADQFTAEATAVVSIGRFGLGRHLRRLCSNAPAHIAFGASGSGCDPYATADNTVPLAVLESAFGTETQADPQWLQRWNHADAAADSVIRGRMDNWPAQPTGIHIADEVLAAAKANQSLVFAAASRSIRDIDLIAAHDGPEIAANLGVNGIDGLISTAAGVALASGQHVYAQLGDLAFLHGSNGLLVGAGEPQPNLTIVVNDDNGGAIFSDLEQGATEFSPWFERVFGTPHDLDLVALARGYGITTVEVFDLEQLRHELQPHEGVKVVVVVGCSRESSKDFRASLRS